MAKFSWGEITSEDVIKAIHLFDEEQERYPEPRSTFLLYDGKKYPAKHIRGMAYKVHYGKEISKGDYSGGQETARFFQKLGFEVQYARKNVNTHPVKAVKKTEQDKEPKKALLLDTRQNDVPEYMPSVVTTKKEKVKIPVKGVIEQKNALQLILNKICDGDIVCEKTFPWMKTPDENSGVYKSLYDNLSAYRGNQNFAKKNVSLRCDFVCEKRKLIIEYDERQHFSEARRRSLLSYQNIKLNYDRNLWIKACEDIQAKDNQPEDRDEVRAFYDSVRDIEAERHGYTLVRLMHGQMDFCQSGAEMELKKLLAFDTDGQKEESDTEKREEPFEKKQSLKIGLYLQTRELHGNIKAFNDAMDAVRISDIDILVLPEISYVPFEQEYRDTDFFSDEEVGRLFEKVLDLSRDIGRAIVVCNEDKYGTIMSIYANAFATENETLCKDYIKHTMAGCSACELDNYDQFAEQLFQPVQYKGHKIGLTICYDCNHSMFSRKYGLNGVDMILNCTGGNVIYDKWYKYNKVRAIENHCYTFVTMGGSGAGENPNNYVYGFTPNGKEMCPALINGKQDGKRNHSGGIYVYDTEEDDGEMEPDSSIDQAESVNKKKDLFLPVKNIESFIKQGTCLCNGIWVLRHQQKNVIFCLVEEKDIIKPEKYLKLLYAEELKKIPDKCYVIVNRWKSVDREFYRSQLSVLLKVRAMENYCAVILTSDNINKCYQSGQNRTAQVVKEENGEYGIDLSRTGGPETIWKNKQGMKASWRKNIEWLIRSM